MSTSALSHAVAGLEARVGVRLFNRTTRSVALSEAGERFVAEVAPALIARFELQVLAECGFQLDLERCAASGSRDDLIYVSPKTGRAISAVAGAPWRDRLLALPAFLRADDSSTAPTASGSERGRCSAEC